MKSILIIIVVISFSNIFPQSLWQIRITMNPKDTSKEGLKSVILDEYSSQIDYEIAAFYLAYYYKDTEKQWLLDNLITLPISDRSTPVYIMKFQKFVTDQIVRGYLGDPSAIPNLQAAIDSMSFIKHKLLADRYLCEAGVYNNYNIIETAFLDTSYTVYALEGLWSYANSPLYRDEVVALFEQAILNSDESNDVSTFAGYLYWIDKNLTIELLNQKFQEFMGWNRQSLFIKLYDFDPHNQPNRSMWAIPLEPDEKLRAYYIPFFPSIAAGIFTKAYLQPFWINFLRNWYEIETSENIKDDIIWFIYGFQPLLTEEDLTMTVVERIEKLSEQVDSMYNYTWLLDSQFKNELHNVLQSATTNLLAGDSLTCRTEVKSFQDSVDYVYADSLNADPRFVTLEGWKFLYWNAQYILDRLPGIPITDGINTYSVFATHGVWLEQNSEILSGNIGVNEISEPPFMDSGVELSIGISTGTPAGYTIKANRIKVKMNATVNADVYYNELENNGTLTGTLNTPLELPLFTTLPEFHTSTPGTENIVVPQNGEYTLTPGAYGEIQVKKNGRLIFTGGEYHIFKFNGGDNNQLLFQSESEVRIKDKFDSGQGSYIGPQDTTSLSADKIVFYVEGINGTNGNLGATPKAAKIGISNTVKANFYVPNGTLWLRQNSEVEGSFIGNDVDVGIGVTVKLNSAF